MAGGEGSRLRPLTSRRPKPLVPVVGRPCMEHVLRLLRRYGIAEVVVTLQYLGAEIRDYFGDGSELGMSIEYVVEDRPLGTAGSVGNAAALLEGTFLVISGDALTDIDLGEAIRVHQERQAKATVVLSRVSNPLEYGVVITDASGRIQRFLEKPSWGEVFSDQVNTGIYVMERTVLDEIPRGQPWDWAQDLFPRMLERGAPLYGWVASGYWCDIGNTQSYLQANWDALAGRVACEIDGRQVQPHRWIAEDAEIDPAVRIEGPAFIGRDVKLRGDAFINGPVVIDRHGVVDGGAKVSNSVLWPRAYIGENARLRQAVVCQMATIKPEVLLDEGSVIGDRCVVGAGAVVDPGVRIWPNKEIEAGATVHESVIWAGTWRSSLFTSYGISGLTNIELTPEWCARLGAAWAAGHPKGQDLAICRDRQPGSRMIKRAMISGMLSAGAHVVDLSELPVPVTCHATRTGGVAGAAHIVSSPLDHRSSDIHIFDAEGLPLDRRSERKLENLFFREDFRRVVPDEIGPIAYPETAVRRYGEAVLRGIDAAGLRRAGVRCLVDYGFSSASLLLPHLLQACGVDVIPLHAGFEEAGPPRLDPGAFADRLAQSALIARTVGVQLGAAIDAAGERVTLIDDAGAVLDHDEALAVVAWLALEAAPGGTVVVPASAPKRISDIAADRGGRCLVTKVAPPLVLRAAARHRALVAGDGAGGYAWPGHLPAFDGIYTILQLLSLLARLDRPLSALRAELPPTVHRRHQEPCPWEAKGQVMRVLLDSHRGQRLDLTDGMKVPVEGGWVLVLPDPDRPRYWVVASVAEADQADQLVADYGARVRAAVAAAAEAPPAAAAG